MQFIYNLFGGGGVGSLTINSYCQAQLAQSNYILVGWAEIALILTFTHPPTHPQGKHQKVKFNMVIDQI